MWLINGPDEFVCGGLQVLDERRTRGMWLVHLYTSGRVIGHRRRRPMHDCWYPRMLYPRTHQVYRRAHRPLFTFCFFLLIYTTTGLGNGRSTNGTIWGNPSIIYSFIFVLKGGAVTQRVERWTCDEQIVGSKQSCVTTLRMLCTPTCLCHQAV